MKISELLKSKPIKEDSSVGATATGAVSTSMGSGAGFGTSIFMRRGAAPKKKKSKQ